MAEYNKIGQDYNLNRFADSRIINRLIDLMNAPNESLIADIGAGTGNYTNELAKAGFTVDAIEPSQLMIKQAKKLDRVRWIESSAENMDLENNSYDGIVSTLAIHHFKSMDITLSNIYESLKENRSLVIFGADPRKINNGCWFKEYFGDLIDKAKGAYTEVFELISKLESVFQNNVNYIPFNIPHDITDGFFYAGWQEPEKYLDENFRNSISVFAQSSQETIAKSIDKLRLDLDSGEWDKKYGSVRGHKEYNGGYYFLKVKKTSKKTSKIYKQF